MITFHPKLPGFSKPDGMDRMFRSGTGGAAAGTGRKVGAGLEVPNS